MMSRFLSLLCACAWIAASAAHAQPPAAQLAIEGPETRASEKLTVHAKAFRDGDAIPERHSEYGEGVSPELSWTTVSEAKSYAVILEDPDAKPAKPFVHWLVWNLPADATELLEGVPDGPELARPAGARQGRTSAGSVGYFGPRPPRGDPSHRYVFQVFALDRRLDVPAGSDRAALLAAMNDHVVAKGQITGRFPKPPEVK